MSHKCKYCDKVFEKSQSMGAHQKWCNPETRPSHSKEKNPMWGKSCVSRNQWSNLNWDSIPFSKLGKARKRALLLKEANNACIMCGFSKTRSDGTIILQIDHIDGNRLNNDRSNLKVVCPNCHAVYSKKFMHIGQRHSEETKKKLGKHSKYLNTYRRIPSVS